MKWHPFAEKFPLLEGDEREALKASIKATNGIDDQPIHFRVVNSIMEGLDGRNRFEVCKELKIKPVMKRVDVSDEEVHEFILRRNVVRRHLTEELRKTIVAGLKVQGESNRKIAGILGVSEGTIRRDVQQISESGAQNYAPDSQNVLDGKPQPRVTGKDGKSYPPKPKVLCGRCARIGQETPKGCASCKAERAAARKKHPREPGSDEPKDDSLKNGAIKYDWKPFTQFFGGLMREVDRLCRPYHCKDGPEAEKLRDRLMMWKSDFKALCSKLSNAKAPTV